MLGVMQRHGEQIQSIFTALFKNNPIERVFRLLDEEGSVIENAQLIASLPSMPFLKAIARSLISLVSCSSKEMGQMREMKEIK